MLAYPFQTVDLGAALLHHRRIAAFFSDPPVTGRPVANEEGNVLIAAIGPRVPPRRSRHHAAGSRSVCVSLAACRVRSSDAAMPTVRMAAITASERTTGTL